jgi:D-lactate dehydrogenase
MVRLTRLIRKIIPRFPIWSSQIEKPPELSILKKSHSDSGFQKTVVYFPTCISRVLGSSSIGEKDILQTFLSISKKAGIDVIIPQKVIGICCGQIFSSKGFKDAYEFTANSWVEAIWRASSEGNYAVVVDVSSCAYTLHQLRPALSVANRLLFDRLNIIDSVDYLSDWIMQTIQIRQKKDRVILHPVCSLEKMGLENKFRKVAYLFANEVIVPVHSGCCGMAGDRGFIFPELTSSATLAEASEVQESEYDGYYSTAKTCEMAISEATKRNYESILYLADECAI